MPDPTSRSRRIPKSLPVTFQQGSSLVKAYAMDISRGGLFVATQTPLQQGDRFTLRLQLPGDVEELDVVCEVAWARKGDGQVAAGMGVRFVQMPPQHEALLKPFVTTLERLDFTPYEMTKKDKGIVQDYLKDLKAKPRSK